MVHAGGREQARNRRELHVHAAVREDDDRVALFDRLARAPLQILERARQPGAARLGVEEHRQRDRLEAALVDVAQPGQLLVVDDGRLHLDLAAGLGPGLQEVRLGADRRAHRRHQLFANRVERRIGDLREQLREVVVQQPRLVRQHGERRVGAHRSDRLLAVQRHRREQNPQILLRVAERALPVQHRVVIGQRQQRRGLEVLERDHVLGEPLRVRLRRRQLPLDLLVGDDAALLGVDQEDAARVQPLLQQDVLLGNVEHADFGRHDDEVVLGHVVARRTQAVAIEHGADDLAVGERDRRRAVPRLHHRRVILVERLALGRHRLVPGPRLGNHHEHRVRQRAAGHDEELEHVVEGRRVAAAFADDRQDLLQIVAEEIRLAHRLARVHPVDVAAQRVDLAVVRDVAVRMRERPRRERVRAEPLVHQRERRLDVRIHQIGEHRLDLIGDQHALVDQRVRRQARDVEIFPVGARDRQPVDRVLDPLADDVELPLERASRRPETGSRSHFSACTDEHLLEVRLHRRGRRADQAIVGRQIAPAEQRLPFLLDDLLDQRLDRGARRRIARQEHASRAVLAGGRQRRCRAARLLAEKLVRHLNEDAGAVAGVHLAAARAAMEQVDEQLQRLP